MNTGSSAIIKLCIDACFSNGMRNKTDIYSKVVESTGYPRPTVRRVAREFIKDMEDKIKILKS